MKLRKRLAAGVLLLAFLLSGCCTTVVRPTIGEPATGTVPTQAETTMPQVSASKTTVPPTTAAATQAPTTATPTTAAATKVPTTATPTTAAATQAPTTAPATTAAATKVPTTVPPTTVGQSDEQIYILNTSSKKFHLPSCGSVKNMKPENKAEFTGTRDELTEMGYEPCGNCKP